MRPYFQTELADIEDIDGALVNEDPIYVKHAFEYLHCPEQEREEFVITAPF